MTEVKEAPTAKAPKGKKKGGKNQPEDGAE